MKCRNCGNKAIDPAARYCQECGAELCADSGKNGAFFRNAAAYISEKTGALATAVRSMDARKRIIAALLGALLLAGSVLGVFGCAQCACTEEPEQTLRTEFSLLDFGFVDYPIDSEESAERAVVDGAALSGIPVSDDELEVTGRTTAYGTTYYRVKQSFRGIPVYAHGAVVVCDEHGNALSYTGNIVSVDSSACPDTTAPAVTPELLDGIRKGADEYFGTQTELLSEVSSVEADDLVIYADDGIDPVLAFFADLQFMVGEDTVDGLYLIEASSGRVLCEVSIGDNNGAGANEVHIAPSESDDASGSEWLNDTVINIYRLNDNVISLEDDVCRYEESEQIFPDDSRWEDYPRRVCTLMHRCLDMYMDKTGRDSYDNNGTEVNIFYNDMWSSGTNAYALSEFMILFDSLPEDAQQIYAHLKGEGVISVGAYYQSKGIDVLAHEFTHLVSDCEWAPASGTGEISAVNEALSDIFGEFAEHYMRGACNWIFGDENDPTSRNMRDPASAYEKYPEKISYPAVYQGEGWLDPEDVTRDDGGEHHNSLVISHAAYKMLRPYDDDGVVVSGTLTYDLGIELWYRSLLMLPSDCDFAQLRACVECTARTMNLEGSLDDEQLDRVIDVFDESGIGRMIVRHDIRPQAELVVYDRDGEICDSYRIVITNKKDASLRYTESVTKGFCFPEDMTSGEYYVGLAREGESGSVGFSIRITDDGKEQLQIKTPFDPPLVIVIPEQPDDTAGEQPDTPGALVPTEQDYDILNEMVRYSARTWPTPSIWEGDASDEPFFDENTSTPKDVIRNLFLARSESQGIYTYFWDINYDDPDHNISGYWEDPLGILSCTAKLDADKADWIIRNVFGLEPDRQAQDLENHGHGFYYHEDSLYLFVGQGGGTWIVPEVKERYDLGGGRYGVHVYAEMADDGGNNYVEDYYMIVSLHEDEQVGRYWRFHRIHTKPDCFEVPQTQNTVPDNGHEVMYAAPTAAESDFEFTIKDGKATITAYNGTLKEFTIPSRLGGVPVVKIANHGICRRRGTEVEVVVIPEGMEELMASSFADCDTLRKVYIPASTFYVSTSAFSDSPALEGIYVSEANPVYNSVDGILYKTSEILVKYPAQRPDEHYNVPESITSIANHAFQHCTLLKSVTLHQGVTSIGEYAFNLCYNLESVSGSSYMESIGEYAFYGCTHLKSFDIPYGVKEVSRGTFASCKRLESVTIPDTVTYIGIESFAYCPALKTLTIPYSVTEISASAFIAVLQSAGEDGITRATIYAPYAMDHYMIVLDPDHPWAYAEGNPRDGTTWVVQ